MADDPIGIFAVSSRGPTDDGRIKPDVVAPSTWVLSVYSQANHPQDGGNQYDGSGTPPNRWYKYMGGTSMATPLTAGAATLIRQYFNDVAGLATPSSALVKATLINGAYDMTPGQYGTGAFQEISTRPDYVQGWGRVDLANSLMLDPPRGWWYDDHDEGLGTGDAVTYTSSLTTPLTVMDDGEPLRVSLVWTDYPGTPPAGGLVNDLDLEVIDPSGVHHYGNGTAWDRVNNVEGVDILAPTLGHYTIVVHAYNVAQDTQPYALVVSGALGDSGCEPLADVALDAPGLASVGGSVPFTATVAPPTATTPIRYFWDFGDDLSSSGTTPTTDHVYGASGLYTATVTATNCSASNVVTATTLVETFCLEMSGVDGSAGDPVLLGEGMHFQAFATPTNASPPISYTWDFGGAGSGSGQDGPTPVFTYTEAGPYTVVVTATNCDGDSVFTDTFEVTVQSVCQPLTGIISSAADPVELGQPMHFESTLTPTDATQPVNYIWNFGGAGSGSGLDGPSPVFTYTEAGLYNVAVAAINCSGSGQAVDSLQVRVQEVCQLPEDADFAWGPRPVQVGAVTTFTASVGAATLPLTYTWHFGDDGSRLIEHSGRVSHTFNLNGTFPVTLTLTVANPCGVAAPVVRQVGVSPAEPRLEIFLPIVLKQS